MTISRRCVITGKHHLDVTHDVSLADRVTLGGAFSTFWTHARGRDSIGPISIGEGSYLGAGVHVGSNVSLAPETVVGMGAVVVRSVDEPGHLIGGVPAKVIR